MPEPATTPVFLKPVSLLMEWICLIVAALAVLGMVVMVASPQGVKVGQTTSTYTVSRTTEREVAPGVTYGVSVEHPVVAETEIKVAPKDGEPMTRLEGRMMATALALPVCGLIWGLWCASRMFRRVRRGEFFNRKTASALRNFAIGLLVYKLLPLITLPIAEAMIFLSDPKWPQVPTEARWVLNPMEMDGALTVVFLGVVAVFAHLLSKAAEMAEDHAQIV